MTACEVMLMVKKKKGKNDSRFININLIEPRLEMLSNREIIIDGCKGVIEYEENMIKLNIGKISVSIGGDGLIINSFENEVAVISGQIIEIAFLS